MKISFIVPAYNVSKYIKKCVDSILSCNMKDIEVIVVNDGSTDDTLEILNKYNDDRLKIISKQNGGASAARNDGINASSGEFLAFIDGDDFIDTADYEAVYEYAENFNADIVVMDFYKDYKDKQEYVTDFKTKDVIIDKQEYFKNIILGKNARHNAVNKLIKRELFNDVKFPNGIFLAEDFNVISKIIFKAQNIVKLNKAYYHYLIGENNTSGFESLKGIMDHKFIYDDVTSFINKNVLCDYKNELLMALELRKIKGVYLPLIFCKADLKNENFKQGLEILKRDLNGILQLEGFKKLRLKYRILFKMLKNAKTDEQICKILTIFNAINNLFSGRKLKDFRA
ncbi:sugar transferase [Campylobacter mucosalis]|uniref:Glycosyltransferase, family 2 n=1 Tax=Campylobacter mucosalis CCUG 21559 TaxID=1032067 RepID=A0A6G5QFU9_9BACT|nr:glycosyltransferase family 2 protein [Campylobacter mucosalis]KEA45598.1 sugar transferase [Campylobacter mucosalis]QCD44494.1 glycosyltransferase, family 2 [Campylobacter mucosalis CCUG 21559]QKF62460.1 glycosyltransferase, family 2 [Campylobacter mucosalis]